MTKTQARAAGLAVYQGAPCIRGHAGKRFAGNGECVDCHHDRNHVPSRFRAVSADRPKSVAHPHVIESDFIQVPTLARLKAGK
ncbi:MAG TPA: hypothetical protein VGV37_06220 [Aliidongia sp.]|uniref:hypothetical protein n=1 Tax=Aliidongia sp. TaxID=1914230 RepID=UPI002DDDA467|nr:hypothetical protein [Aliidongia sp.]HEV2674120.1 hypothetical protein [Aliidongia sp.]